MDLDKTRIAFVKLAVNMLALDQSDFKKSRDFFDLTLGHGITGDDNYIFFQAAEDILYQTLKDNDIERFKKVHDQLISDKWHNVFSLKSIVDLVFELKLSFDFLYHVFDKNSLVVSLDLEGEDIDRLFNLGEDRLNSGILSVYRDYRPSDLLHKECHEKRYHGLSTKV